MHRALSTGRSPGFLAAAGCLFSISQSSQTWNRDICTNGVAAAEQRWMSEVTESLCTVLCVRVCSPLLSWDPADWHDLLVVWPWLLLGLSLILSAITLPFGFFSSARFPPLRLLSASCGHTDLCFDINIHPSRLLSTSPLFHSSSFVSREQPSSQHDRMTLPVSSLSNLHDFVSRSSNKSWNLRFLSLSFSPPALVSLSQAFDAKHKTLSV